MAYSEEQNLEFSNRQLALSLAVETSGNSLDPRMVLKAAQDYLNFLQNNGADKN